MTTVIAEADKVLISKVARKQHEEKLSDYKFADKLGMKRALWQLTRTGRREVGLTLLKAVTRTYPELCLDVLNFLRENHESSKKT